jgi:tetratricopeptide (TPR) repeat protein
MAQPMTESGATTLSACDSVAPCLREGLGHFHRGAYPQAIAAFSAAIMLDPSNADTYAYRGDAHRLCCAYELAVADLTQAIQLCPSRGRDYVNRGLVYQLQGDYQAAVADFTEAIRLNPQDPVAHTHRGSARAAQNEDNRAIADFTEAIRLDPQHFWAYENRAQILCLQGDYSQAIADYSQVLTLNPNHAPVYIQRGDAFLRMEEYDRAIADYNGALWLQPSNAQAYAHRGNAYRLRGDKEKAIADYTTALGLDPNNPELYCDRGTGHRLLGNYIEAWTDLDEAIRINPTSSAAYYQRGKVCFALDKMDQALADYTQALGLCPDMTMAYVDRALVHHRSGQIAEIIADCSRALERSPKLALAYYLRGNAHFRSGDHAKAIADFNRSIALDPGFPLAYNDRGLACTERGQYELALADYAQAIRLDPGNAMFYLNRSVVHQLKGDQGQAVKDFNQAFRLDRKQVHACWIWGVVKTARREAGQWIADYIEKRHAPSEEVADPAPYEEPIAETEEVVDAVPSEESVKSESKNGMSQKAAQPQRGEIPATPAAGPLGMAATTHIAPSGSSEPYQLEKPDRRTQSNDEVPRKRSKRSPRETADDLCLQTTVQGDPTAGKASPQDSAEQPRAKPSKPYRVEKSSPSQCKTDQGASQRGGKSSSSATGPFKLSLGCPKCTADFVPVEDSNGPVRCMNCKTVFVPGGKPRKRSVFPEEFEESHQERDRSRAKSPPKRVSPERTNETGRGREGPVRPVDPTGALPRYARSRWELPKIPGWLVCGIVAAIVVGVGYFMLSPLFGRSKEGAPVPITAAEMGQEYSKNATSADRKYSGRMVQITGKVANIVVDYTGSCIMLETSAGGGLVIECYVYASDASNVKVGQTVTLVGRCEPLSGSGSNIKLFSCQFGVNA